MPERPHVVGFDLGSNTFSVVELCAGIDGLVIADDSSEVARLSEHLLPGGTLSAEAIARSLSILERQVARFDARRKPRRAVGTAVLRLCRDPERFTGPASRILGVPVEIVTGEAEARLTTDGALLGLDIDREACLVLDVGGQSTEISWRETGGEFTCHSLPIGVVGLTERFVAHDPPQASEFQALFDEVRRELVAHIPRALPGPLIVVGGTATNLARLDLGLPRFDRASIHGALVSRARLAHWLDTMLALDAAARTRCHGVGAGRADVFPAGLAVLSALVDHLDRDRLVVSANGLRVGVALSLLPTR